MLLPPLLEGQSPEISGPALAAALLERLASPAVHVRAPFAPEAVDLTYDLWHRAVRRTRTRPGLGDAQPASLPSLSVFVLYDGERDRLAGVLDALDAQSAPLRSQTLVIDASADHSGGSIVNGRVPVLVAPAALVATTRTQAAFESRADVLVMLTTHETPLPGLLDAIASAAARTSAAVYSPAVAAHALPATGGGPEQGDDDTARAAVVPIGGPPTAGLSHQAFAAGPYAIRSAAFRGLGGFASDARADDADHELLNRAAVAGLRIEVLPEQLATARVPDRWTVFRSTWPHDTATPPYSAEQALLIERPYRQQGDDGSNDMLGLLRGARGDLALARQATSRLSDANEQTISELREYLLELEEAAAQLRLDQGILVADVARLLAELDAMQGSSSWRITRPLRVLRRVGAKRSSLRRG